MTQGLVAVPNEITARPLFITLAISLRYLTLKWITRPLPSVTAGSTSVTSPCSLWAEITRRLSSTSILTRLLRERRAIIWARSTQAANSFRSTSALSAAVLGMTRL